MSPQVNRLYVKTVTRMSAALRSGTDAQTMTEYALILATVAIAAYITYQVMGQDIGSMVTTRDRALSSS